MRILERLLGPPRQSLAVARIGQYPLSQTPGILFANRTSGSGVDVNEDTAMSLSAVFAAVNKLSSITAALPLSVYRKSNGKREVADAHPANYLLHTEFNEEMSAFIGRRTGEFHRLLWGNSYTEINWDGAGRPAGLWPLLPWTIYPRRDDKTGELYYWENGRRRIEPADMLHETLISKDGVCGQSWIEYAISSLGLSISAQTFSETFFGNGARPSVILSHDGNPDPKQRKDMKEGWEESHKGADKAHSTAVIWGAWKVSEFGGTMTPEDSQLLDSRRFTTEEVSRWLNVPPHILYDLSRSTNNNIEHQGIEFVQHCLGPTLVLKEQEFDRKLLDPPKLYSKHNVTALLRGDSAARSAFYTAMTTAGIMNVNECRDLEEQNPIGPDGDVYFKAVNMQPIERAINPPEPPPVAPPAAPPKDEPPADPPEDKTPAMRAALRSLLEETFSRLMRKELNEGRRAAKKPKEFLSWLDSFYPEFQQTLAEALGAPLSMAASMGLGSKAANVASWYCMRSRDYLLSLAGEAKPSELPAAAERLFAEWEVERPAEEVEIAIRGTT